MQSVEGREERAREGNVLLRKDIQKKEVCGQGKRPCVITLLLWSGAGCAGGCHGEQIRL